MAGAYAMSGSLFFVLRVGILTALVLSNANAQTGRTYRLEAGSGGLELRMQNVDVPAPGAQEVLVRMRAVSLNHRDVSILSRLTAEGRIPLSDGAGEVVAVGAAVTQFDVGDRVAGTFFADWTGGRRSSDAMATARGGGIDGMLAEFVVSHENGLVDIPDYLSYEEAATLPCAAVTAWRALFTDGGLTAGETVLLEGTGGVSIFGLQLTAAAGAIPIITSSSDRKLERARALGAAGTVNYRTNPEWQRDVLALTNGVGVDHVLEVVGQETLLRALDTLAYDGHIAIIGGLSGRVDDLPLRPLPNGGSVTNIFVGSREDFIEMNEFLTEHQLHPVIDRVFEFEDAAAAYAYMGSGAHLGKIVISL